jgi:hypothetical protein
MEEVIKPMNQEPGAQLKQAIAAYKEVRQRAAEQAPAHGHTDNEEGRALCAECMPTSVSLAYRRRRVDDEEAKLAQDLRENYIATYGLVDDETEADVLTACTNAVKYRYLSGIDWT